MLDYLAAGSVTGHITVWDVTLMVIAFDTVLFTSDCDFPFFLSAFYKGVCN